MFMQYRIQIPACYDVMRNKYYPYPSGSERV